MASAVFDKDRDGATERFDEIDDAAVDEIKAHRIDHEPDAIGFSDEVVCFGRVGEPELVLEAGASAALDREAQDCRRALLFCNGGDAGSS